MSKILSFLNGKKTNIGGSCLFLSLLLTQVVISIWHFNPEWMQPLIDTLNWAGGILVPAGLVHKQIKKL